MLILYGQWSNTPVIISKACVVDEETLDSISFPECYVARCMTVILWWVCLYGLAILFKVCLSMWSSNFPKLGDLRWALAKFSQQNSLNFSQYQCFMKLWKRILIQFVIVLINGKLSFPVFIQVLDAKSGICTADGINWGTWCRKTDVPTLIPEAWQFMHFGCFV